MQSNIKIQNLAWTGLIELYVAQVQSQPKTIQMHVI